MSNLPSPKEMHERAGESAKETRGTVIKLATGSVGVLFLVASQAENPLLSSSQKISVACALLFLATSLGAALWFGFSDAQWSYYWGVELNDEESTEKRTGASQKAYWWHARKSRAEKMMLIFFFLGVLSGAVYVALRLLS